MGGRVLPLLWVYGPAGVGKTTVGWQLFTELSRDGTATGYVDIDQLGICYPPSMREPATDPGRYAMKARNLESVVANLLDFGVRRLVVSGVVHAERGVEPVRRAALTACRLRAEPGELRRRLAVRGRGEPAEDVGEVLRHAADLDRNALAGVCVDTTGRDVDEVLRLVQERTRGWLGPDDGGPASGGSGSGGSASGGPAPGGEVLLISGATATGKSTVGWLVYEQVQAAGTHAAFVDLEQIGFLRPEATDELVAANLAALWRTYHAAGARRLVVVGHVGRPEVFEAALPAAKITVCRLHAGPGEIARRVALRAAGHSPARGLAGDEIAGRPSAELREITERAVAEAAALENARVGGDRRVDTDGRSATEIAAEVFRAAEGAVSRALRSG